MSNVHGTFLPLNVAIVIRDASKGGFAVESVIPFEIGAQHHFTMPGPDGERVAVEGVCRHRLRLPSHEGELMYLAGFEFCGSSANHGNAIFEALLTNER
jgi:hypothetical protein